MKRNVAAHMEFSFNSEDQATAVSGAIHAQVAGVWVPWKLGRQSKVCDFLKKGKCPLAANEEATYGVSIKVPFFAKVGMKVVVRVRLQDQNNKVVACTRFPVVVVA